MLSCCIVCAVSACIEIGTSWMFSLRRWAVTMIVASWLVLPSRGGWRCWWPAEACTCPSCSVARGGERVGAGVVANARQAAPARIAATAYGTLDFMTDPPDFVD